MTVPQAIAQFSTSGKVVYAEPAYIRYITVTNPNDPKYTDGTLWNLNNSGQNGGTPDADIDAPEGWDRRTVADRVVVAVIDTGVRYTHEDLAANIWTNPGEIAGNGIDDDGDGYVDDVHGINARTGSGDPNDDHPLGHGTHVSGIIGAAGNNGKGIVGVAWSVKIMALKAFDSAGFTSDPDLIECISYATAHRANIINASWGGGPFSESLRQAIAAARNQGILFVASAGNNFADNDGVPFYPAGYDLDNIVAVAATTKTDAKASYSDTGLVSVHLGAPGGESGTAGIYSAFNTSDSAYQYLAGTSMAAPHVTGALALLWAYEATESYSQLKNRLLSSTDPLSSLAGKCQTGGRLNLNNALSTTFWWPRNDSFANAMTIARPSGVSSITAHGNNVDATKETGEPNHAGNSGGKSVWWKWTAPDTTPVTLTTKGSGLDTLLAVYTGSSVSSLTPVASNDNGGQCGTSQLTFTPAAGTTYRIAVDGYNGAEGTIKLTLQSDSSAQPTSLSFTLSSLQRPAGQFKATITGPASASVLLETSPDLSAWTGAGTVTLSAGGSYNYTDPSASASIRFYRASISSSSQQSCNTVGYVDVSIPSGQSMIANPLDVNGVNYLGAVFPSVPDGTTIYKWNDAAQSYDVSTFLSGVWSSPNLTLVPGEGAIIQPNSGAINHSYVGQVAQGYGVNPVPNLYSVRSSIVPQTGLVKTDLGLPVISGDTVMRMVNGSFVTYTYSSGSWSPSEPRVAIGESFFNHKNVGFWWHRNFLVWP
jgi:subtilisin family serine protease